MTHILALDQGTTSSRAIVFDADGGIAGVAQEEFPQHFPKPGWVEHDPDDIWQSQLSTIQHAIKQAGIKASEIAGIGITNQRETTIVWDRRTGEPIHRAIVWQDRRTASICDKLSNAGHAKFIRDKTGLLIDAYFSGTKAAWLLDNVEGARGLAEQGHLAFGTVDTWLIYKLTNGAAHVTDPTNASRTLLCDIHQGDWSDELLAILRVPRSMLPQIVPSSGVIAETDAALLGQPIPIAGIAGDQQAALFGQLCVEPGMVKCTYGTGCFMLMNTGSEPQVSQNQLLTTIAWQREGHRDYALEGSVFVGGAVVQWLRDELGIVSSAAECSDLASTVPDSGGVIIVPAFAGLGAPHWDSYARGMMIGATRGTTKAHLCRAAIDSIAFQVADLLDAMRADASLPIEQLRVDGGATASEPLLQFQADLLGMPVVRPRVTETTALGAAYLAGLATGVWNGTDALSQQWQIDRTFEPGMPGDQVQALRQQWSRAVERAKGWAEA